MSDTRITPEWSARMAALEPEGCEIGAGALAIVPGLGTHLLYETSDPDAPDCIKDRNGEVVLGLCRVCGKGESELSGPCTPRTAAGRADINTALALCRVSDSAIKRLVKSLNRLMAEAIAEAWGRAQKEGMTLHDLSRMLNWSLHRTRRTMEMPVHCRGGLRSSTRLMCCLGIVGFDSIELVKEIEAEVKQAT